MDHVKEELMLEHKIRLTNNVGFEKLTKVEIDTMLRKANAIYRANPDSAFIFYQQALSSSYNLNYTKGIAQSLVKLGSLLFDEKKEYNLSYKYFHAALPYSLLLKGIDDKLLSTNYNCLGNFAFINGQYDSALHFYIQALNTIQSLKKMDTSLAGLIYSNIGSTLGQMGQYEKSVSYIEKSKSLLVRERDSLALARVLANLGTLYVETHQIDSAIRLWNRAIKIFRQHDRKYNLQDTYNRFAILYLRGKDIPKASLYLDSAVSSFPEQVWNNYGILQNLGCVHYFNGELDKALPYYQRSLELCMDNGPITAKLNAYETMADIYHKQGKGALAYINQKAYSSLKDSLLNADKVAISNQIEVKYRVAEKDKLLAQNKLQLTRQFLWIIATGSLALLSVILLVSLLHRRRHKLAMARLKATLQGEEKERKRLARELHDGIMGRMYALKLQFEAIPQNTVYESGDYQDLARQLEQSIEELRTTAHNLLPEILKQEGLVGALQLFCERISKLSAIHIEFQMTGTLPSIDKDIELNIYRIVQELVQNIMKHSEATQALVQITVSPGWLGITIDDNGKGMPERAFSIDHGIGLYNLHQRVQALNGSLEIENNNGTSVYLEFDIEKISTLK